METSDTTAGTIWKKKCVDLFEICTTMKIENDEMWEKIKAGELKGLSIEGYFIDKMEKMSETIKPTNEEILSALNEIIQDIKNQTKGK
mgnify:CR=1 FL=1